MIQRKDEAEKMAIARLLEFLVQSQDENPTSPHESSRFTLRIGMTAFALATSDDAVRFVDQKPIRTLVIASEGYHDYETQDYSVNDSIPPLKYSA
ncbi:MAG: hypothetical protein ACI9UA_002759 [Pseudoalteromonas tetraodonis]|jgi:hypothetical protein